METPLKFQVTDRPSPISGHMLALDGLRGLAVLGVMGSHLFPSTPDPNHFMVRWAQHGLNAGATGVDLFFVLSGFLITGILYDTINDSGFFRKFYARRSVRIFPLYYGVLIAVLILTPWLHIHWKSMQWSLLLYMQNTGYPLPLSRFDTGHIVTLAHFWSLAVEEQFYLVWPLMVFFIRDLRKLFWTCLTLSGIALLVRLYLALHHADYQVINTLTVCRMDSLLAGAALALILRTRLQKLAMRHARTLFLVFGSLSAAALVVQYLAPDHPEWSLRSQSILLCFRYSFLALASVGLIGWTLKAGSITRRVGELAILRFFGRYSYGLYVLHALFITIQIETYRGWVAHISPSKPLAILVAGVVTFATSTVAAVISYRLFESPFLRLKKHFRYDKVKPPVAVEFPPPSPTASHASNPDFALR